MKAEGVKQNSEVTGCKTKTRRRWTLGAVGRSCRVVCGFITRSSHIIHNHQINWATEQEKHPFKKSQWNYLVENIVYIQSSVLVQKTVLVLDFSKVSSQSWPLGLRTVNLIFRPVETTISLHCLELCHLPFILIYCNFLWRLSAVTLRAPDSLHDSKCRRQQKKLWLSGRLVRLIFCNQIWLLKLQYHSLTRVTELEMCQQRLETESCANTSDPHWSGPALDPYYYLQFLMFTNGCCV